MGGQVSDTERKQEPAPLTCIELIREEIKGKFLAVERYDSMLWKIRSGYVVVLYGALAVIAGGDQATSILENTQGFAASIVLIWGFSICGFFIDSGFVLSKLRVVVASDELYDIALQYSLDMIDVNKEYDKLKGLLQNSGESLRKVPLILHLNALRWLVPLYFGTPIVGTAIYFMLN